MNVESVGPINSLSDLEYEDATSLEDTAETAELADDASQESDTTTSSTEEEDTTPDLEGISYDDSYPTLNDDSSEAVYDDSGEAVDTDASEAVDTDASEAVNTDASEAVNTDASEAVNTDASEAVSNDTATNTAVDGTSGTTYGEITLEELLDNPELLLEAGIDGLDLSGIELTLDSDGMLSAESKEKVNELVGYLSDVLGGIEVAGQVYVDDSGNVNLHLTAGEADSIWWKEMGGTVYNVHSHPNGFDETPSQTDLQYEFAGAEDAIVVSDGVPGNEDGSDYNVFA